MPSHVRPMLASSIPAVLLVALLVSACGSDSQSGRAPAGGGSSGGGSSGRGGNGGGAGGSSGGGGSGIGGNGGSAGSGGVIGTSGGSGGSAGSSGSSSTTCTETTPAPGLVKVGNVGVANATSGTTQSGSVDASFVAFASDPCKRYTCGACTVTKCPPGNTQVQKFAAGDLTITGPSGSPIVIPSATTYSYSTASSFLYASGAELTATAVGTADVPPFTVKAKGPSHATFTAPDFTLKKIDRTKDLKLTWTADGTDGVVDFAIVASSPTEGSANVDCAIAIAQNGAIVPAAALALIPDGVGSVYAYDVGRTDTKAGDWGVTLNLSRQSSGNGTDGLAYGIIMLP